MTAWRDIDPNLRTTIERVCSTKELDAVKLSLDGAGRRRIAHALGISESSARDRLRNARRKILDAVELDRELTILLDSIDQEPAA